MMPLNCLRLNVRSPLQQRYSFADRVVSGCIQRSNAELPVWANLRKRHGGVSLPFSERSARCYSSSKITNDAKDKKSTSLSSILQQVRSGSLNVTDAELMIQNTPNPKNAALGGEEEDLLAKYANIDHTRSQRSNFPEAIFGSGKTPTQIAQILDDMARHYNETNEATETMSSSSSEPPPENPQRRPILATRVTTQMYQEIANYTYKHGTILYHETARIVEMIPSSSLPKSSSQSSDSQSVHNESSLPRVVIATAGTTDMYVAEEAAVTLESSGGILVDRVNDVGVAGLHRILSKLHILQHPNVKCVIVCAGMDGALPSVVGGLARCPVIAVPTSIGYGVAFDGISPLLTMLNSCSPGVGVVNIDNGFGAAALAYKMIHS